VDYLPAIAAVDFSRSDRTGTTSANLAVSGNVVSDSESFAQLAYSPDTDAAFAKLNLALAREQKLGADWSLLARASGQIATGPLLGIEQFSVGGLNSVRGYMEGDEFGDHGWIAGLELRAPFLSERVAVGNDFAPVWLRGIAFVDAGQRILADAPEGTPAVRTLLGTGFGVSANLDNRVDLRIVVGWPFFETPNTRVGEPRAYFSLGGQF
ncbi:MAG: ShlB/FhaC/HecB family hemolysin secretion/activation protein, partial [Verrucomicrobiales bacterium]|nr:ShlB/FhaC/HecB family hemolysin secretion/activation protein [Verrucomicrobiales bacterium]